MLLVFLLKGVMAGMLIAVPVGPVGVLCIRRTIFAGRLAGFISGLGAAAADAFFGIVAGFGLTFVSDWLLGYEAWLKFAGSVFLIYVGVTTLLAEPPVGDRRESEPETPLADFISTFLLTLTNPITILAFLAIFAALGFSGSGATFGRAAILVLGVWLGSMLWWTGLTLAAGMVRLLFERDHLVWISRGSGGILLLSGLALLASLAVRHLR